MVIVLASCYIKKLKKIMRGVAMATILISSSTKHHGKYSQCPAFDFKQSPAGRSPKDIFLKLVEPLVCFHIFVVE